MNVIHSIEDNDSQIIHVSVNSNDRGATGEKGDSIVNVKITDTNRLEATLSNGQTIDGGAIPAIKTRRVFIANMDGIKRTYILPLDVESSQVSYILMNGVVYSDGYVLQSGEITLNYDDLPAGRLEIVLNDNSGSSGGNISLNGKTGDINLKTINGVNLDGDGNIELATLDAFNNEVRDREKTDNELRDSLNNHATRISNNEGTINSHSDNLSSLNANISSVNNQMTVLNNNVHEVSENYVPKTRRINDKFLSHDMRLTADDVEALPITAGATHPIRGELVVNGHITAENATQDNHVVTKAQLDAKVAEVVNSAPETLNTLEELAKSLGDDPNFATTVASRIGAVDKKIDAEVSKLSASIEANTENLKSTTQKATTNSTNISLLNSAVATNKLSTDTQFSKVAKEQSDQNSLISDILNAFSKESEKGTNLKLNTSATKVLGMTIYGNMAQDKTNGYNLLTLNKTQSSSGGNFTVRDTGYIDAKGTLVNNWTRLPFNEFTLLPGTYTLSREGNSNYAIVIDSNNGGNHTIANLNVGETKTTFTTTRTEYNAYLAHNIAKGTNLNISARFMLGSGSTIHPYEPSTLGYQNLFDEFSGLPAAIHGAKLENKDGILKLTGKPAVDWLPMITRENLNLLDKTEYTIVNYAGNSEQLFVQVVATKKDGTGKDFFGGIRYKTAKFTTDSTKYSQYDMKVGLNLAAKYPEPVTLFTNVALYKGGFNDDYFPEYTPYASGFVTPRPKAPQVVKELAGGKVSFTGKNLFNTRFGNRTLNNVEIKTYEDGSFELNGTPTIGFSLINIFNSNTYIQSGKYKLKIEHLGGSVEKVWPGAYFVHTIPIQKGEQIYQAVLRPEDLNNSSKEFLITVGETLNDYYAPFVWVPHNAATNQAFWNYKKLRLRITLVKEGEDTEFTPFETTDFLLPSGLNLYKLTDSVYDEVKLENGIAKLIKRVGKLELAGEENDIYPYRTNQAGVISFKYGVSGRRIYTQRQLTADIVCSHFNSVNEDALWGAIENKTGVSIFAHHTEFPAYADKVVFWFTVADQAYMKITDVTSFRNWLKAEKANGTPVTVYYEMRDYTETEITDPAILTQLNKLMEARTYDGLTNISVTGTDLTPEIKVKYMRKIGE